MVKKLKHLRSAGKRLAATIATVAVVGATLTGTPALAANSDIGYPTFSGSSEPVPAAGAEYTPGSYLQRIFEADQAAGAGGSPDDQFWVDKMLARTGTAGSFGDNNQWLFTRGRAAFMKEHSPSVLGFGGQLAYWESIDGRGGFTITARVGGSNLSLTEDTTQRLQTPSFWRSVHKHAGSGLEVVQTKYITDANVLVTNLDLRATSGALDVTLRAVSPYATSPVGEEFTGAVTALNNLTTLFPKFSGNGFTPEGNALEGTFSVTAGSSVTTKVQLGLITEEITESSSEYETIRDAAPVDAYRSHVTSYNQWWADNIPYLDTPEDNIDKTLFYRWWLMRYNFLDANIPGNDYQFPTSMEGVLGYNNSIVLTTGMFIDDLKYFRDPIYSYGPWVSAGETSKSYKFTDNPGDPANWSNSYTQYISEAGWRAYQLHGGPSAIAQNLGEYAEYDVKGLVDAYDFNDNGLIEYSWGAMTGNDADAVSFHWKPGNMDRAENAYLYSNAKASADAYRVAGNTAKADEMEAFAQNIKSQVMDLLWNPDRKLIEHLHESGEHVPWKEINNYYPFSVGLVPKPGDADYDDDYVEALRLFADDEQYPIFPFYTANQFDQNEYGGPGSNNFSVINSTVTFRMLSKVLRDYPTDAIDAEWYKKLLYWNAWSHYQNGGDNRLPDQNEFWSEGTANPQKIGYRSWIHHTILGTTNFTMIEDAMGLRPRSDAKIELDPIDIGWDHFTANNIRYRDRDLTITWDAPGGEDHYGPQVPDGYSVFLDGELAFTADKLAKVVYDPATGSVDAAPGVTVSNASAKNVQAPQEVRFGDDARVVDLFAKAGADIAEASTGSANLAQGRAVDATFSATGRAPSGAVNGTTINEPFWGTAGSPNESDSLTVELGSEQTFDDARVYFYRSSSSATVAGYAEPSVYTLEYRSGGVWQPVPGQARTPVYPRGNFNHMQFPEVTGDAIRVNVTHAAGFSTGVKEVQLFDTGVLAPPSTNQPPQVNAWRDSGSVMPGQAKLIGTVKDDGLPGGTITSQWSVVSAPAGGLAIFDDAAKASTTVRFTAPGEYVLRLSASDGEADAHADLTVVGDVASGGENVALGATPTAEFTAGWNKVTAVNDGKVFHSGGDQGEIWGTWSGSRPSSRWIEYSWPTAVRVSSAEVSFWTDQSSATSGAGVNIPKSWKAQYWDGAAWVDVGEPSEYGIARNAPNTTTFEPVTTTKMRLTLNAAGPGTGSDPYAGVAISEWKVFAEAPVAIEPIDVRTEVGTIPSMPATVDATFGDGSHSEMPVSWAPIAADQVAAEGSFTVIGLVNGSPLPAQATVWVRSTSPSQINVVDAVAVSTTVGIAPILPKLLGVLYNDGSREDLPVSWDAVDPADYAVPGEFIVPGEVQSVLPGTKAATATVTVGDGGAGGPDTKAPVAKLTASPNAPATGWYQGDVTVTASATDNVDPDPAIEVAINAGAWESYVDPVQLAADGVHTVQARATDASSNVSSVAEANVKIDMTAPALIPISDAVGRTVKASATDALSGLQSIEHRLDGASDWSVYSTPILVGLDEAVVELRATDVAGNVSEVETVTVPKSDGNHRRNVALIADPTASFTSAWNTVNGLNDDVAPTSSGDVTPNDNPHVWGAWPQVTDQWVQYDWVDPVTIGELGAYFIHNLDGGGAGIAVPKAWHGEYWDGDAGTAGEWVEIETTDAYGVELDGFNVVEFTPVTTTKLRLAMTAQGTEEAKGSLGIKEWQVFEAPAVVIPDTEAPVVSHAIAPITPATGWHTGDVTVTATAVDNRDPAPVIEMAVGDGAWQAYAPLVIDADGVHSVKFRATDEAGNVSGLDEADVNRDATKPVAEVLLDADTRSITVLASDAGSGIAHLEYRVGDGTWVAYGGVVQLGDEAVTVSARATDAAGNVGDASLAVPVKPTTPGPGPGVDPVGPSGELTGNEVLRIGVAQVAPGEQLPVEITGAQPGAVFQVEFRSVPTTLGYLTVGSDGAGRAVFTVPAGAQAGSHTVAAMLPDGEVTATVLVVTPGATTPVQVAVTGTPGVLPIVFGATGALLLGLGALLLVRKRQRAS